MDIGVLDQFVDAIKQDPQNTNNKYSAVVSRIDEEGIVWVNIAGSEKETPAASASAEVQRGDHVGVEWRNNKVYIVGNDSNPSAGVERVLNVEGAAKVATAAANEAVRQSLIAGEAASSAQASAASAANNAQAALNSANEAKGEAQRATVYANGALDQLGVVEDVVGVLNLLQKNGVYELTEDTTVQGGKWYFKVSEYQLTSDSAIVQDKVYYTRSGSGTEQDPYVYTIVSDPDISEISTYYEALSYTVIVNPTGDPSAQGWYELTSIDEAIRNYVSSQLVVTDEGLWLKRPEWTNIQTKVLLSSTDGVVLYGTEGQIVGKYGETAQIGDAAGFHIEIDGTELGFYQAGNKVAYINNNQLYITQSVVLQQMDLGSLYNGTTGFGQWSWKVHKNGQTPSKNNLNLKWIG